MESRFFRWLEESKHLMQKNFSSYSIMFRKMETFTSQFQNQKRFTFSVVHLLISPIKGPVAEDILHLATLRGSAPNDMEP